MVKMLPSAAKASRPPAPLAGAPALPGALPPQAVVRLSAAHDASHERRDKRDEMSTVDASEALR
jgi:hypothetical protein